MRKPKAQTLSNVKPKPEADTPTKQTRKPQAFAAQNAIIQTSKPENWSEPDGTRHPGAPTSGKRNNWALKLALWAGGLFLSLGLALAADRLIRDLFIRYEWLGWLGSAALGLFILGLLVIIIREILALRSLNNLDKLRQDAIQTLQSNTPDEGRTILAHLQQLYHSRPDLARARQQLDSDTQDLFDGADMVHAAEHRLMGPLDARAKALTAAAARRVAIVTAISPRALVDIAFVAYESMKLARAIATLYGAKPGLFGSFRLAGAILGHLAVTGGVALGDSVVQQLLGHGLAAKLSARLGEGLVNGLMSVRVGIAAMGVTRPLLFDRLKQPQVMDFMADLANITKGEND